MHIARVRMPRMGTSVHESTVVEWKKAAGDRVTRGEVLLTAESDKVDFEVECPVDGTLTEILVAPDTTVPVGEVLALLETEAEVPDEAEAPPPQPAPSKAPGATAEEWVAPVAPLPPRPQAGTAPQAGAAPRTAAAPQAGAAPEAGAAPQAGAGRAAWISPRVQRLAAERGLDLGAVSRLKGTGAGGRVTARDVERCLREGGGAEAPEAPLIALRFTPLAGDSPEGERERREPHSRLRRRIAENLTRSAREIPQVTNFVEADMERIRAWREANKEEFLRRHGTRLSYTPFLALALIDALRDPAHARFNAIYEEDALLVRRYVNLGLAVDTDGGLMVPVLHGADALGFVELALAIEDLAARARAGALGPDEVREGTITLTNFGASGVVSGNPLINPPQTAIVGTGAIVPRPAALPDGSVAVRPLMSVAVTFDHRANDGMAAGRFAGAVRAALERMDLSQMRY